MQEYFSAILKAIKNDPNITYKGMITKKVICQAISPLRLSDIRELMEEENGPIELWLDEECSGGFLRGRIPKRVVMSYVEDRLGDEFLIFDGINAIFSWESVENYLNRQNVKVCEEKLAA